MKRLLVVAVAFATGLAATAVAQETATPPSPDAGKAEGEESSLESQFVNYLHFALIGRFDVADQKFGQPLLNRPEFHPMNLATADKLVKICEKYPDSIDILTLLINNTSIGENAKKILALVREAYTMKRRDPAQIKANIKLLAGTPMQQAVAIERLTESGEYAVPWMLGTLTNPKESQLQPFVIHALPRLGHKALNPLIAALQMKNETLLRTVVEVLGKIGYPQSLPYLQRLATSATEPESVRKTATQAIDRILLDHPGVELKPADEMFTDLAEQYFAEIDSLRPDPRQERANLWRIRPNAEPGEDVIEPVAVDNRIYDLVQCMACCQDSLALDADQTSVLALWLAANFRREARLGLDVESDQTVDERKLDPSRPENFPRSIYFARMAGPTCCQIVLTRAIKEHDRNIALGAVSALNVTAGRAAMTTAQNPGGMSLGEALYFPDLLVRVQAALALGKALPPEPFHGSTEVVPVLSTVLTPSDKKYYMLVDPDSESAGVIQTGLINAGAVVISADRLRPALNEAHRELTHLDGIFLASDMRQPTVTEAIDELNKDDRFCLVPIIVLVKENETTILERIGKGNPRVGSVFVLTASDKSIDEKIVEQMLTKLEQIATRCGLQPLSPETKLSLALQSAQVLQGIAESQSPVFNARTAMPALIDALRTGISEELQVAAASALSWIPAPQAQQAIAGVALSTKATESLRITTFGLLADSARRFGGELDESLMSRLMEVATHEPNLTLRTAASQAMGATNPPVQRIVPVILSE